MKKGFTLAEVLITLGIIGVVAALTAPALVKNTGSAKVGPALAKFVNTFETASEQLLNDDNADKLSDVASGEALLDRLQNYIIMTPLKTSANAGYTYTVYAPSGNADAVSPVTVYQMKDGTIISLSDAGDGKAGKSKGAYKGIQSKIFVDINGNQNGPSKFNRFGKDVFGFYLDDSGILIPIGSNAENFVTGSKGTCNPSGATYDAGLSCTGKIADNGWKAD